MRLGNVVRSLAMLSLAVISVLAIVALLALRLGMIAPAEARPAAMDAARLAAGIEAHAGNRAGNPARTSGRGPDRVDIRPERAWNRSLARI